MISSHIALVSVLIYSFSLSFLREVNYFMFIPLLIALIIQHRGFFVVFKKMIFLNIFIVMVSISAIIAKNYDLALLLFLRANAVLFFTLLLFYDKDIFDISKGMSRLRFPPKIVSLFFLVAKFIVIIKNEYNSLKETLVVRNFKKKTSIHTYKIYANVIGMLVVKCFDRASKLRECMILRGFNGKIYLRDREALSLKDIALFSSTVFTAIGVAI